MIELKAEIWYVTWGGERGVPPASFKKFRGKKIFFPIFYHKGPPFLKFLRDAISALCGRIWTCEYIFDMCRSSGIWFWYRLVQLNAATRTRTHFKTRISNFALCGPIWVCLTIFCIYRISGIQFWYRLVEQNAALRTRTHFRTLGLFNWLFWTSLRHIYNR